MAISKISATELATVADANTLVSTYSASGTTIERGETFTLPSAGTTAVSNGALRLEALKGDCTITNNGNSTLTNVSGVNGTVIMRSGASEFPAFVRNSSLGSTTSPPRESFVGNIIQIVTNSPQIGKVERSVDSFGEIDSGLRTTITPKFATSTLLLEINFHHGGSNSDSSALIKFYDYTNSADVNLVTNGGLRNPCHAHIRQKDHDSNDGDQITMRTTVSAGSTIARTYTLYERSNQTSTVVKRYFLSNSDAERLGAIRPCFTITEITT